MLRLLLLPVAEQGLNTAWNLLLGFTVSYIYGPLTFGVFVLFLSTYFVTSSVCYAMTAGVAAIHAERLGRHRTPYLYSAVVSSLALSTPVVLLFAIAAMAVSLQHGVSLAMALWGLLYIVASCYSDLLRRFSVLIGRTRLVTLAAIVRVSLLAALATVAATYSLPADALAYGALSITLGYLVTLAIGVWPFGKLRADLVSIASRRQVRTGLWLAASLLAVAGSEQILAIVTGLQLGLDELGGWRAANYLFGLFTPVLGLADVMIPRLYRSLRDGKGLRRRTFILLSVGFGMTFALIIGLLNGFLYLPFLGADFAQYAPVSLVYIVVFSAIWTKTVANVFVKLDNPRIIFVGGLAGAAVTVFVYLLLPPSPLSLSYAVAVGNVVPMLAALYGLNMKRARHE